MNEWQTIIHRIVYSWETFVNWRKMDIRKKIYFSQYIRFSQIPISRSCNMGFFINEISASKRKIDCNSHSIQGVPALCCKAGLQKVFYYYNVRTDLFLWPLPVKKCHKLVTILNSSLFSVSIMIAFFTSNGGCRREEKSRKHWSFFTRFLFSVTANLFIC